LQDSRAKYIVLTVVIACLWLAAPHHAQTTQTKFEGQVVCCADCWAEADRNKVEYGLKARSRRGKWLRLSEWTRARCSRRRAAGNGRDWAWWGVVKIISGVIDVHESSAAWTLVSPTVGPRPSCSTACEFILCWITHMALASLEWFSNAAEIPVRATASPF